MLIDPRFVHLLSSLPPDVSNSGEPVTRRFGLLFSVFAERTLDGTYMWIWVCPSFPLSFLLEKLSDIILRFAALSESGGVPIIYRCLLVEFGTRCSADSSVCRSDRNLFARGSGSPCVEGMDAILACRSSCRPGHRIGRGGAEDERIQ